MLRFSFQCCQTQNKLNIAPSVLHGEEEHVTNKNFTNVSTRSLSIDNKLNNYYLKNNKEESCIIEVKNKINYEYNNNRNIKSKNFLINKN